MKKYLLILCALISTLTISAQSQSVKTLGKKLAKVSRVEAQADSVSNFQADEFEMTLFSKNKDWYCNAKKVEKNEYFIFDILNHGDAVLNGTYDLSEMDPMFTQAHIDGKTYALEAATVSITERGDLDAIVKVKDMGTWHVYYSDTLKPEIPEITEHRTVEFTVAETDFDDLTSSLGAFQFMGAKDGFEAYVTINADSVPGSYTFEDLYPEDGYTIIVRDEYDTRGVKPFDLKGEVVRIERGYKATFTFDGYDGCEYTLVYNYVENERKTEDFTATNLKVTDYTSMMGVAVVGASNEQNTLSLWICPENDSITGHFTQMDLYRDQSFVRDEVTKEESIIRDMDIDIKKDGNGYAVTGWVLCKSNVLYNLNLSYVMPEVAQCDTIVIADAQVKDKTSELGYFTVFGEMPVEDGSRYVQFTIYSDQIVGEYEGTEQIDDVDSYVAINDDEDFMDYIAGPVSIVDNGDGTFTLKALAKCLSEYEDGLVVEYDITMTGKLPKGLFGDHDGYAFVADYDLEYDKAVWVTDNYDYSGNIDLAVTDEDETKTVYLEFHPDSIDGEVYIPAGVYNIETTGNPGTVMASQGIQSSWLGDYVSGSCAANLDYDGMFEMPLWMMVKGTVTVAKQGVRGLNISVDAENSNGQSIVVNITGEVPEGSVAAIEEVAADKMEGVKKVVRNGKLVILKNGKQYNVSGMQLK